MDFSNLSGDFKPELLSSKHIKTSLSRVEVTVPEGGANLSVTLTGHEMAIAAAESRLMKQERKADLGFLLVERGKDNRSLIIRTAVNPEPQLEGQARNERIKEKAANVVEAVFEMTGCRLGGISLTPEAAPVFNAFALTPDSKKAVPCSAAVAVKVVPNRADRANLLGQYSLEVIRRKYNNHSVGKEALLHEASQNEGLVLDPGALEGLRLLQVTQQHQDVRSAELAAEKLVRGVEKKFDVYYTKPMQVMLVGLSTQPLDDDLRRKSELYADILHNAKQPFVTTATLTGEAEALDAAEKAMKNSFPPKIFKMQRDGELLNVMMCGDREGDPIRLVAMLQAKTRCTLPMDINPGTAACVTAPAHFSPMLETELWDDVPKRQRGATGTALAGYVGLQFPSHSLMLPERGLYNKHIKSNARLVVHEEYPTRGDAQVVAEALKDGVEARMARGTVPKLY